MWGWLARQDTQFPFSLYGAHKTLAPLTPTSFPHATLLSSFLCQMVTMAFLLPGGLPPALAWGTLASLWGSQHQICMALAQVSHGADGSGGEGEGVRGGESTRGQSPRGRALSCPVWPRPVLLVTVLFMIPSRGYVT